MSIYEDLFGVTRVLRKLDEMQHQIDHLHTHARNLFELVHVSEEKIMLALDGLIAQVEVTTSVEQKALVVIQGIAARIEAAAGDPVQLQALVDSLKTSSDSLAAAIAVDTPPVEPPV